MIKSKQQIPQFSLNAIVLYFYNHILEHTDLKFSLSNDGESNCFVLVENLCRIYKIIEKQ